MSENGKIEPAPQSKIASALLAAQREIEGVSKDSTNPHFKSKFADLTSVIEATVPILNKHGIVVIQLPTPSETGSLALTTLLLHESGESISGTAVVPLAKNDPQAYGSAMTYARRYSLGSAVSLKFLDDDAETAVGRGERDARVPVPPPPKGLNFGIKKNEPAKAAAPAAKGKAPVRGKAPLFPKVAAGEEGGEADAEE